MKKRLPIDKFIEQALYDKKKGYYMQKIPFGKKGDYITSPDITYIFSEMIGLWAFMFKKNVNEKKNLNIIELGAGNGNMMKHIIKVFHKLSKNTNTTNFYIFEKSPLLKKIQKNNLKNVDVKWIKNLAEIRSGINLFIGNEFLDSLTIKQFIKKNEEWYERYIVEDKNLRKIVNIKININKYEKKFGINFSNKQNFIELPIKQIQFINLISDYLKINEGGVLFIDYGYNGGKMFDSL